MWLGIFAVTLIVAMAGVLYFISKIRKFEFIKKLSHNKRTIEFLISIGIILLVMICLTLVFTFTNMIVIILHLLVFWILTDIIALIAYKISKKTINSTIITITTVVITIVYLSYGWYIDHNVQRTNYTINTDKELDDTLRIVQISDTHIGATFHAKEFAEYIEEINQVNPDAVVITGDFIDDSTSYDDFVKCSEALGNFKTKYGVYFVFGNHDKGYSNAELRGYGYDDIIRELTKSNVIVLEDENVLIDNRFYIIGRQDLSERNRSTMNELIKDIDTSKFMLLLDHQPSSYDEEMNADVDMVLSGHTHGGQMIPVLRAGEWMGVNDATYGYEKRHNTNFIVSSGMSDWEIKFKTGCISEYVVIDIN